MAQVLKPSEVKIITKDGELEITLKLDINVKSEGTVTNVKEEKKAEDKANWEIPDFGPSPKLKFGK